MQHLEPSASFVEISQSLMDGLQFFRAVFLALFQHRDVCVFQLLEVSVEFVVPRIEDEYLETESWRTDDEVGEREASSD